MYLTIKALDSVNSVNSWNYSTFLYCYEGQPNVLNFQLVLQDQNKINNNVRYLTQATSYSVSLIFPSIDSAQVLEQACTQPFADDKSIWRCTIPSASLPKSGGLQVKMIEDGITRLFVVKNIINTSTLTIGSC